MNPRIRVLFLLIVVTTLKGQDAGPQSPTRPEDPKLPDGTSQREAILKDDHARSLKDAAELTRLGEELTTDLEKNDRHVLSIQTLKKLDEMERLIRRIRGRMKRY
ncbi:MAG: hypothetical protein H7039_20080 [Bryobacteraceae bacterium]|nr:hypothetical protein [Bryobacteraceae bacterium]